MAMTTRCYQHQDAAMLGDIFYRAIMAIDEQIYTAAQKQAWAGNKTLNFWQQRFARTQPFVACINGQPAGFIEFIPADAYIDCCYVAPEHQGKGLATALIRHAIRTAETHHPDSITVHASDVALPVFTRLGFTTVERQQHGPDGIKLANTLMRYKSGSKTRL